LPVYPEITVADYLDFAADLIGLKHNAKKSEPCRVIKATDISAKLLAPIFTLPCTYKQIFLRVCLMAL
jgi:ABC-2 type transport system ATP-binding protein